MTNPRRKKRGDSYIAGEKGINRVRLYRHPRDGKLFLEYREEVGAKKRVGLGHTDFDLGKQRADELAAELRKHEGPRTGELTLKSLFDNYDRHVGINKTDEMRGHDHRARALFERCWEPFRPVKDLDVDDWNRFIKQRRDGTLRPPGNNRIGGGKNRIIEYDLRFLIAVLNWAENKVANGVPLLERRPFRGDAFEIPKEIRPRQPEVTPEQDKRLRTAARRLGPRAEMFYNLARSTGHRGNAIRQLRWSDLELASAEIEWRADADKEKAQHKAPLAPADAKWLKQAQKKAASMGNAPLFPSDDDPSAPISRNTMVHLWTQIEREAGVAHVTGLGWHALRRKFANDGLRAGVPLPVLAALGGWNCTETLVKVYIKPDREALQQAARRMAAQRATAA